MASSRGQAPFVLQHISTGQTCPAPVDQLSSPLPTTSVHGDRCWETSRVSCERRNSKHDRQTGTHIKLEFPPRSRFSRLVFAAAAAHFPPRSVPSLFMSPIPPPAFAPLAPTLTVTKTPSRHGLSSSASSSDSSARNYPPRHLRRHHLHHHHRSS